MLLFRRTKAFTLLRKLHLNKLMELIGNSRINFPNPLIELIVFQLETEVHNDLTRHL